MPGWIFRVTRSSMAGPTSGQPLVEVYLAHIADRLAAWGAVATEVNRIDPMAVAEATGEASDMRLEAEGVPVGGVKLLDRSG